MLRYYVDADLIGLGKLLVQVRPDVTYAGDGGGLGIDKRIRPASPIVPRDLDPDWIPKIAAMGLVVLTKDRHMLSRPAERNEILASGARHVRLQGAADHRNLRKWDQLEIVMSQWRKIEGLTDLPGPWIYVASRTSLRRDLP